jgi:hypothetical protein
MQAVVIDHDGQTTIHPDHVDEIPSHEASDNRESVFLWNRDDADRTLNGPRGRL